MNDEVTIHCQMPFRESETIMCVPIDHGVQIFNFIIDVDNFVDCDVYKLPGIQLFGMSGSEWDMVYGPKVLPKLVTYQFEEGLWTVHLITKWVIRDIHIQKFVQIDRAHEVLVRNRPAPVSQVPIWAP